VIKIWGQPLLTGHGTGEDLGSSHLSLHDDGLYISRLNITPATNHNATHITSEGDKKNYKTASVITENHFTGLRLRTFEMISWVILLLQ